MSHGERSVRPGTLGVHAPLGNHLAVEMRKLLDQPNILQERRAARTGALNVDVIADGRSRCMGQFLRG